MEAAFGSTSSAATDEETSNLYAKIGEFLCCVYARQNTADKTTLDLRRSGGINISDPESLAYIVRPHHERNIIDEARSLSNLDDDDGFILSISFSELCKIRSVMISAPSTGEYAVLW